MTTSPLSAPLIPPEEEEIGQDAEAALRHPSSASASSSSRSSAGSSFGGGGGGGGGSGSQNRAAFSSRTEYVLSMIGYTVGLGNVWRWPYQCFTNGGAAFLVVYLVLLAAVAMPVFLLEVAVGQRFRSTPVPIWSAIHPALCGLGWSATVSSYVTAWYYNVIDAWSLYYLGASIFGSGGDGGGSSSSGKDALSGGNLPWAERGCEYGDAYDYGAADDAGREGERACKMNATVYWEDTVLRETANVSELGGLNWPLAGCLLLAWALVFLVLARGVESAGKVVYFTAVFPYAVLVVLLVRGLTLKGASMGLRFLFVVKCLAPLARLG